MLFKRMLTTIILLVVLVSCISVTTFATSASSSDNPEILPLRAGGGGSGWGDGGSGGSGTSTLGLILDALLYPGVAFVLSIPFYIILTKRSRKAKRLMKQMAQSDNAWKYSDLSETVYYSYMAFQNAWTDRSLSSAAKYLSAELFAEFQEKIDWMKVRGEINILLDIELLKALPVAVHDDPDNSRDYVWFYIKGRMVDYTVDENTMTKISGSTSATSFIEYWQYVRRDGSWVVNKILQGDEYDRITCTE